jgi:hypothetical protein
VGAAGGGLSVINSLVAWNSGTSFPTAVTGDRYWRTDKGLEFYYDGTRWLSTHLFAIVMPNWNETTSGTSVTTTGTLRCGIPPAAGGTDWYIVDGTLDFDVNGGTALGASHNWVVTFAKNDVNVSPTTISTYTINSGSSSVLRSITNSINALLGTASFMLEITATKTGTPGNLIHWFTFTYRVVTT